MRVSKYIFLLTALLCTSARAQMQIGINAPNWVNNGNIMGIHNDVAMDAGQTSAGPWIMNNISLPYGSALPVGAFIRPMLNYSRPGTYTLKASGIGTVQVTFEGKGTFTRGTLPATNLAQFVTGNESFTFTMPSTQRVRLAIQAQDPKTPITNVNLFAPGYGAGLYHPEYLASLQPFVVFRSMDFQNIVASNEVNWADRVTRPGENLESFIALGNQLQRDMWICLPSRCISANNAPTDYAFRLGELIAACVDPARTVYLEYGDEIWNYGNPFWKDTSYVATQGAAEFTPLGYRQEYARSANKLFNAVKSRIGPNGPKIKTVFAGQLANIGTIDPSLPWAVSQGYKFDCLAGGMYWSFQGDKAAVATAWSTGDQATAFNLIDQGLRAGEQQMIGWIKAYANYANKYGMQLVGYEGGPAAMGLWNDPIGINAMKAYTSTSLCKQQHLDTFKDMEASGVSLLMYYSHRHIDGTWAAQRGPEDINNGRYRALLQKIQGATPIQYLGPDTATQGNWVGKYGSLGSIIAGVGDPVLGITFPKAGTLTTFAASGTTTDVRALQLPDGSARVAASWLASNEIDIDIPAASDGSLRVLTLYFNEWVPANRTDQIVQVVDGDSGTVMNTQELIDTGLGSQFNNGIYLRWVLEAHAIVKIIGKTGKPQVAGIFLDPLPAPPQITLK